MSEHEVPVYKQLMPAPDFRPRCGYYGSAYFHQAKNTLDQATHHLESYYNAAAKGKYGL